MFPWIVLFVMSPSPGDVTPPPPPPPVVVTTTTTVPTHVHDGYSPHHPATRHETPQKPTTTTTVQPRTPASAIGLSYTDIGSDGEWWCTDLIAWLHPNVDLGVDPGPTNARDAFPATNNPQPGDIVLIDLLWNSDVGHDPTHPTHVAVFIELDGDNVRVVEANGASRTHVVESAWPNEAIIGYRTSH